MEFSFPARSGRFSRHADKLQEYELYGPIGNLKNKSICLVF